MSITLPEEVARASRALCALERFAQRRERFLECLDWSAFDEQFIRETSMADDRLNDELAETWLYLSHLEDRLWRG